MAEAEREDAPMAAATTAAMTLDEFKQGMFRSLRDSGTMELVRAQLRRQIIEKLQQHQRGGSAGGDAGNDDAKGCNKEGGGAGSRTNEDRIASGLVAEFLRVRGLENTLAVFLPEAGGARNQLDSDAIMDMLHFPPAQQRRLESERKSGQRSLLAVVVSELETRLSIKTLDGETQTMVDCFDHRIALDNQLRRVESTYLAECESQKLEPTKSIEQRMLQYQTEYDALCDKRLQEELERYKATELALARTEDRKRYEREVETVRTSLFQEHREKVRRLAEREREMELAFTAKRADLETSLFDTRQSLMQELEKIRTQEAEQQARREADFRKFTAETKRLETWEENLRAQEKNLEGLIAHRIREKEREWTLERQRVEHDYQYKLEELRVRESALSLETDGLKAANLQAAELRIQCSSAIQEQKKCENEVIQLQKRLSSSELEKRQREVELCAKQEALKDRRSEIENLTVTNARLASEKATLERDAMRLQQINEKLDEDVATLDAEVKSLQQQMLAMKLAEASEVVAERRKLLKVLDEERERFYWKENELLTKVRDVQTRLVESEATAEKFQSQYEDERVHVESLRHDVASLNTLLTQAHMTINAKHGAGSVRDYASARTLRATPLESSLPANTSVAPSYDGVLMMKMMEMMAAMQVGSSPAVRPADTNNSVTHSARSDARASTSLGDTQTLQKTDEEKQLKSELQRRERELLEQREYEKRQKERLEAEEREMVARRQQFEDEIAQTRLAKREEDECAEAAHKALLAEEEAKIQRQVELQQKAPQDARNEQEQLEKRQPELRAQREKEEQDRQRDERLRQAEELEKRIQEQRLEAEEADRQRSEKIAKELEEIQKRREQLDAIEAERQRAERDRTDTEAAVSLRQVAEAEAETKRQQELASRLEAEEAATDESTKEPSEQETRRNTHELPSQVTDERAQLGSREPSRPPTPELASDSNSLSATSGNMLSPLDSKDSDKAQPEFDAQVAEPQEKTARRGTISANTCLNEPSLALESSTPQEDTAAATPSDSDSEAQGAVTEEVKAETCAPDEDIAPVRSEQELEEEQREREEEQKRKQDEEVIDVYRQRVLARKAAEKQRQEAEAERKRKEEEEMKAAATREAQQSFGVGDGSDNELELSEGSFAESSAASSADSF